MLDDYMKITKDVITEALPEGLPVYIIGNYRKSIPRVIPLYVSRDEITNGLKATCLVAKKSLDRFHIKYRVEYKKRLFFKKKKTPIAVYVEFIVDPLIVPKEDK